MKVELVDSNSKVAVCEASDKPIKPVDTETINVQAYWEQPTPPPSASAGMHRIALNIAAPRGFGGGARRGPAPPPPAIPQGRQQLSRRRVHNGAVEESLALSLANTRPS